jgi:sortase A
MRWRGALRGALVAASLLAADAVVTLAWEEPVSALRAELRGGPDGERRQSAPTPAVRRALGGIRDRRDRFALLGRALRRRAAGGGAVGRLRAPAIGLDALVVEGVGDEQLRRGPGHDPRTPLPGTGETVAIAGLRATHGAPFRELGALRGGDRLALELPYATFSYRVRALARTDPGAQAPLARAGRERLVLSAPEPRLGGGRRLVLVAELVDARTTRTPAP